VRRSQVLFACALVAVLAVGGMFLLTHGQAQRATGQSGIRSSVTLRDLLYAPVPAVCQHPSGWLVNGVQPGIPAMRGEMRLAWVHSPFLTQAAGTAFGDLNGDGTGDAATVLYCNAGGVSWPEIVAFYGPGLKLLGWAYLSDFNLAGIKGQEHADARRISYQEGGVYAEWSTEDNGDGASTITLDYSATLRLSGHKIIAMDLVGVTERPAARAFASDLRRGDHAAADSLSAPGVAETAANLFSSYPSAYTAVPACYGLGDALLGNMPAPLAALVDPSSQVNPDTERICAFSSTDPGASWVALGMQRTGWRTWRVLWAQAVS
jgi:hypothetical protein